MDFDTGPHNTAEARTSTRGDETVGTAPSILLGVSLGKKGAGRHTPIAFLNSTFLKKNPGVNQYLGFYL